MLLRFAPAFVLGTVLAISVSVSAAEDKSIREFVLPDMGQLELLAPSGWTDRMRQAPQGASPVITLSPATGNAFQILIIPGLSLIHI